MNSLGLKKKNARQQIRLLSRRNTKLLVRQTSRQTPKKQTTKQVTVGGKRGKGRRKGGGGRVRSSGGGRMTLTPPSRLVELEYVQVQTLSTASHTNFGYPIYTNGAFAVDPNAPSGYTTTPSFSVPASQYAAYRVESYSGTVAFENLTTQTGDTCVCHTNTELFNTGGSNTGNIIQYAANRPRINTIKPIQAIGSGNCQTVHHFSHTIRSIAGESIMQPGYKSLTNTVPSLLTYLCFGWVFPTAATGGMTITVKLRMKVRFLDYIDTLTSFASEVERLKVLGAPREPEPCAGCRYVIANIESSPCPDPQCMIVDQCTNCGWKRRCSQYCQSSRCPFRTETVKLIPPFEKRDSLKSMKANVCV